MPSLNALSPDRDRRRTSRRAFEALRVRLGRTREGILVDLSEGGAFLRLPMPPPRDTQFPVQIEWQNSVVALQARVVRSVQRHVRIESATLRRMEYHVALEFLDPTSETCAAVRRMVHSAPHGRETPR